MMLEYDIISGEYLQQLKVKVWARASEGGWKPQGGIAVIEYKSQGVMYYQAMVRTEKGGLWQWLKRKCKL